MSLSHFECQPQVCNYLPGKRVEERLGRKNIASHKLATTFGKRVEAKLGRKNTATAEFLHFSFELTIQV